MGTALFVGSIFTQVMVADWAAVDCKCHSETRCEDSEPDQLDLVPLPVPPVVAGCQKPYDGSNQNPDSSESEEIIADAVSPANRLNNLFVRHLARALGFRVRFCGASRLSSSSFDTLRTFLIALSNLCSSTAFLCDCEHISSVPHGQGQHQAGEGDYGNRTQISYDCDFDRLLH
jgi:hypothetical protein